jgi:TonB family protein
MELHCGASPRLSGRAKLDSVSVFEATLKVCRLHLLLAFAAFSGHTSASANPQAARFPRMSNIEINTLAPNADHSLLAEPRALAAHESKQRKLMLGSLSLLLVALSIALWHERDFWFPDTPDAESEQQAENSPGTQVPPQSGSPQSASLQSSSAASKTAAVTKPKHQAAVQGKSPAPPVATAPVAASTARTVLPPLEVEVVAGDTHRTVRPGSSSVRVDLQPGTSPQPITEAPADTQTAASVTSNASEHVQMSPDASEIVAHPVRPNYPLLARQMKVQGSVILQALIGKDGIIQNLRVMSGPQILASAAEDAVRQWHFRPHLQDNEPVETQAKITVNFTISTN